jgi:hypothetical protein
MPTQVIHTIKPGGGGDYATLNDWQTAQVRNLVAADEIAVAECYPGVATETLFFSGWTTDPTRYTIIRAAPGRANAHKGIPGAGFKITSNTAISAITFSDHTGKLEGIEVANSSTGGAIAAASGSAGRFMSVDSCIISTGSGTSASGVFCGTLYTLYVVNCFFFDILGFGINIDGASTTCNAYNNTLVDCARGIRMTAGVVRPKNNITQNITFNGFVGTMTDAEANISSDATSPNVPLRGIDLDFVNYTGNNFHLAATDTEAIGAGVDLSSDPNYPFDYDIDGGTRPAGAWDIGADERTPTAAVLTQTKVRVYLPGTHLGP